MKNYLEMTKLNINFYYGTWDEYLTWKKEDKKSQKIDKLIKATIRHPIEELLVTQNH